MNKLIFLFAFNSRLCITNFILILIRFAAIAKPPLRGDHKGKHKIKLIALNKEGQRRSQRMAPSKHQFDDFLLVRSRAALVINISDENRFSEKRGDKNFSVIFHHFRSLITHSEHVFPLLSLFFCFISIAGLHTSLSYHFSPPCSGAGIDTYGASMKNEAAAHTQYLLCVASLPCLLPWQHRLQRWRPTD